MDDISLDFSLPLNSDMGAVFAGSFAARIGITLNEARFSAHVFLVELNYTIKEVECVAMHFRHGSNGMPHFPGSFLPDTDLFGQID